MMSVLQDQPVSSISSTWDSDSAFFQTFLCHPRIPTSVILVFDDKIDIPNSLLFPVQVPKELPQTVLPTIIRQVGDHAEFVQEEPVDLQCLTKILATCVVEDVSTYLDILTLEFSVILERPPF